MFGTRRHCKHSPLGSKAARTVVAAIVAVMDLASASALGARSTHASGLEIILTHNSLGEQQTRADLQQLWLHYDLQPWTWTKRIAIEEFVPAHSDPVLTLNTRTSGLQLLSAYLHEQLHRYEDMHPVDVEAAEVVFRRQYPNLPVGYPNGAESYDSNYLHIITCYSELQALKRLIGEDAAYVTIRSIALDHYRAIYALVLANEASIGRVVHDHHLLPNE